MSPSAGPDLSAQAVAGGACAQWTEHRLRCEGTSRRRDRLEDPAKRVTEGWRAVCRRGVDCVGVAVLPLALGRIQLY